VIFLRVTFKISPILELEFIAPMTFIQILHTK